MGRAGGRYVALPNGTRTLSPGIYLNEGRDFGGRLGFGASRRLRPIIMFVSTARYEANRFDFAYTAERQAAQLLGPNIERALAEQVARLGRVG